VDISLNSNDSASVRQEGSGSGQRNVAATTSLKKGEEEEMSSQGVFPAVGHRYLVNFQAFQVELYFESLISMTYTGIKADGSHGSSETVSIMVEPIRDHLFLVTWQEADMTTVVHLEDYKDDKIITCITSPTGEFSKFHGKISLIS
jgi:hypothetical protein